MKSLSVIGHAVLAGMLWMLSADAVHWFLTPHPDASTGRTALVALQLAVCLAIGVWLYRLGRSRELELEPSSSLANEAAFG